MVESKAGGQRTRTAIARRFRYNAGAPPLCLPRAPSSALPARSTHALVRFVRAIVVIGFAAFALALLAVRFVVFPQIEILSRHGRRSAFARARAAGGDRGADHRLGRLESEARRRRAFACSIARASTPRRSCSLPELEMIVSWTSLPLLELRLKELIIDGPRLAIRRDRSGVLRIAGTRVRSGAGGGRVAAHRLDPSPARDRHPRRADRVGRRSAQRAAARARPRPVPAGEPVRPPSLRIEGHAARRSRGAARSARRSRAATR